MKEGFFVSRPQDQDECFSQKWSPSIGKHGFTMIPNLLIFHQAPLGLSDAELILLINLEHHRFTQEAEIWPSAATLAKRLNKDISTVRRTLTSLARKGFMKTTHRAGRPNLYNLTPTIRLLDELAKTPTLGKSAHTSVGSLVPTPRPNLPTKEDNQEQTKKESLETSLQKEMIKLNTKLRPKTAGWIRTRVELESYKKTGDWPDKGRHDH